MHATLRRDGVEDSVAVAGPLDRRLDGEPLAVTMRADTHPDRVL